MEEESLPQLFPQLQSHPLLEEPQPQELLLLLLEEEPQPQELLLLLLEEEPQPHPQLQPEWLVLPELLQQPQLLLHPHLQQFQLEVQKQFLKQLHKLHLHILKISLFCCDSIWYVDSKTGVTACFMS